MYISLPRVFDEFCDYLDGRLRLGITEEEEGLKESIFEFFSELRRRRTVAGYLREERDYMGIDYIWRYTHSGIAYHYIELAVEHEHLGDLENFLKVKVQHLIDIKADHKVGITYPSLGDERDLITKVGEMIKSCRRRIDSEEYLIILGFPTRKEGKPAILFRGYLFDKNGQVAQMRDRVILQAQTPSRRRSQP